MCFQVSLGTLCGSSGWKDLKCLVYRTEASKLQHVGQIHFTLKLRIVFIFLKGCKRRRTCNRICTWPAKSKVFILPFTENGCWSLDRTGPIMDLYMKSCRPQPASLVTFLLNWILQAEFTICSRFFHSPTFFVCGRSSLLVSQMVWVCVCVLASLY